MAQDVEADGGVCGRYLLGTGWSSSYPETTGYIVPTFLALADALQKERYRRRAGQCVDFLLRVQLPCGAFPGMEIAENSSEPSPFNTAQIIHGLLSWHKAVGDARAIEAAHRAARWLVSIQEPNGAFSRYWYLGTAATYSAHASCWLAELGLFAGESSYTEAASRHLDWVLQHVDSGTGWIDLCGFSADDHRARRAVTHTLAYTLFGVTLTSELLGRSDGLAVADRALEAVARRLELGGWLPGVLDFRWRAAADYVCLTGNAQFALLWLRAHLRQPNWRWVNAALKALDAVKASQDLRNPNPGICGGIPGSAPIWGAYLTNAIPNWSAKFFIDALLLKRRVLDGPRERVSACRIPPDVPTALPPIPPGAVGRPLRIVLYSTPHSQKPAEILAAWPDWKRHALAIVVEKDARVGILDRLRRRICSEGFRGLLRRGLAWVGPRPARDAPAWPSTKSLARQAGIPILEVESLNAPAGLAVVRSLAPDLAVHAGAGILRPPLLAVPRLGTVNAHMGVLPYYRGMNVAEWASFHGDPVGCSVHLIDPGIDTGEILSVRITGDKGVRDIAGLRSRVNQAQLALLAEVLEWIGMTGVLPAGRPQRAEEGLQFFRMHHEVRDLHERVLEGAGTAWVP